MKPSFLPCADIPAVEWPRVLALYGSLFRPLFLDPAYRPVLVDLEERCFVSRSTTEGATDATGRVDAFKVASHEGRRSLLLQLQSLVYEADHPGPLPADMTSGLPGTPLTARPGPPTGHAGRTGEEDA